MCTLAIALIVAVTGAGCASRYRLVYSSGFSFAHYDYVVVAKADGDATATTLFGTDIELGNLLGRNNMRIVGDKEFERMPAPEKARTLIARLSLAASRKRNLISVSFDDAVTGRTVASVSGHAKGDILDEDDRTRALESVTRVLVKAIEKDKALTVSAGQ